ncbi:MAG TPA: M28 family metallopeptidase [Sulfuricaulis sp.]|nr:M28 family metallopeptidase [Sulfuricaulis sp.]
MTLRSSGAIIAAWLMLAGMMPAPTMAASVSEATLRMHVQTLAGKIGERNVWRPHALRAAADYLRHHWEVQGYRVSAHEVTFERGRWANLEVSRPGRQAPNEIVVIGAHYDSVSGSPGANDNGSGVAALLELARLFAARDVGRSVRFVAFVNEEPPFFRTGDMGSEQYARAARLKGEDIRAMLALETIGYYDDAPGSQHYPPFFSLFFPDRGNFIGMVSNFGSRALLKRAVAVFRAASNFPLESVATFGWVPGVDWSDHASFWNEGYPAIMITDTALYRYPYYHSVQDTPDKVDYARLARVTEGLAAVVEALAKSDQAP